MGDVWSEHVLECAKAYIMSFIYIVATVTSGYPLVSGIAKAAGASSTWLPYLRKCRYRICEISLLFYKYSHVLCYCSEVP